jgi:mevalonate kinase
MPSTSASAPGKVILFGEHAVVYGQPAIAVPVTQVRARAVVMPNPAGGIQVQAPQIAVDSPLRALPLDDALAKAISLTLEALGVETAPGFKLRVSSTIPLAAGLGSGAAVSVAVIRAVSAFLGHPLPDEVVSRLAFQVEIIHHGTPSGVDNTVVTYAQPVYFIKGQPIQTFTVKKPFTLVIGDSGVLSPTSISVGDVRKAWLAEPQRYEEIFAACGQIARQARTCIENGEVRALGPLMEQNQDLLAEMGVSSSELDQLIKAALDAGAWGAKLSGGGRGGNMIALVPPEQAEAVSAALLEAGAVNTITTEI